MLLTQLAQNSVNIIILVS